MSQALRILGQPAVLNRHCTSRGTTTVSISISMLISTSNSLSTSLRTDIRINVNISINFSCSINVDVIVIKFSMMSISSDYSYKCQGGYYCCYQLSISLCQCQWIDTQYQYVSLAMPIHHIPGVEINITAVLIGKTLDVPLTRLFDPRYSSTS